jgi:hypothetical protein
MTVAIFTPTDQNELSLAGDRGQSLQFHKDYTPSLDLFPKPVTIEDDDFPARSVYSDFEWITEQGWPADVDALAVIGLLILDSNHIPFPFQSNVNQ